MKNRVLKTTVVLLIIFTLLSGFVATSEENEQQEFIIHGFINDKSGNPLEGTAVSLLLYETNEELLTKTKADGYYIFNLKDLEKGWEYNYTITIASLYNDYEDNERYYSTFSFKIEAENNSKYVNLTLNKTGNYKQFMYRGMSKQV